MHHLCVISFNHTVSYFIFTVSIVFLARLLSSVVSVAGRESSDSVNFKKRKHTSQLLCLLWFQNLYIILKLLSTYSMDILRYLHPMPFYQNGAFDQTYYLIPI